MGRKIKKGDTVTLIVRGAGVESEEPRTVEGFRRDGRVLLDDDHEYDGATGRRIDEPSVFGFSFRIKELADG